MRRRTLLQWIASIGAAIPITSVRAWAQTAAFPARQADTLGALAAVVLPGELGAARIREVTERFSTWVRDYRPGAEMEHGYGNTRLRTKPPSPAPAYLQQLEALRSGLLTGDAESQRRTVETALQNAKLSDLPRTPDGRHIITDLMAFYFRSSEANDLCYQAAIGRDQCRTLKGSENPPAVLK